MRWTSVRILMQQSSQLTELAYDLISRWRVGTRFSPSSVASTAVPQPVCGRMSWAPPSMSHKEKGASKATHSCRCCSHWGNTVPLCIQERLRGNERVFAYLDDISAVCRPGRVGQVHAVFYTHAHIQVHHPSLEQRRGLAKWELTRAAEC